MITVSKLPISLLVWYFVGYVASHVIIGLFKKHIDENVEKIPNTKSISEEDTELIQTQKFVNFVFKWFPAAYIIFILLTLG